MLYVDQKKYIDALIRAAVALAAAIAQIAVLFVTRNYLYYLYLAIGATVTENLVISLKTDRLYPYLRERRVSPLPTEIRQEIRRNVSAMLLHRIGDVAVYSTDNLLIAKFVGITTTGLYSNYMMVRGFLNLMINALFHAVTPVMGRLNATETEEKRQMAFRYLNFFSAWLFGWMSICLFWLYDPFIDIWLGDGYLLPRSVVWLIVLIFYVNSMRIPVANTRSVMGLFWDDRFKSVLEALLNLGLSVLLAQRWGILGNLSDRSESGLSGSLLPDAGASLFRALDRTQTGSDGVGGKLSGQPVYLDFIASVRIGRQKHFDAVAGEKVRIGAEKHIK